MRALGVDLGERRIGLAVSDASATLARPLRTLTTDGRRDDAVGRLVAIIDQLGREEGGLDVVVVGRPNRLDGTPTDQTARVDAFIEALRKRTGVVIVTEDERLTSWEADRLLAARYRDWRSRKAVLDAAAAAVILQDYLDRHPRAGLLDQDQAT
jgi:putative holliday junction resolvase